MVLVSPLYVNLPRKKSAGKRISLNLNWFRNAHFRQINEAKKTYQQEMQPQIQEILKVKWPVKLRCKYYLERDADVGNFHSIVEKFFLDSVVNLHRLPDDSVKYVVGATYEFCGFSKDKPRCEIEIMEGYKS